MNADRVPSWEGLSNADIFEKIMSKLEDPQIRANLNLEESECALIINHLRRETKENFSYSFLLTLKTNSKPRSNMFMFLNWCVDYFVMRQTQTDSKVGGAIAEIKVGIEKTINK